MHMQGMTNTDIARAKGISPSTVGTYIREWEVWIKDKSVENPELFDKVLENSLAFIENYNYLIKNAWEVHDEAKEAGVAATRLSALKLVQEMTAQKARFYQLLGPRVETNYLEKAKRAERVNEILSEILRDTIADCDRCYPLAWDKLRQAFSTMEREFEERGALVSGAEG